MTSRDKHLQQALKHAPDNDLLPSDAVRKKVIDHARAISPSKQAGWLKRWFSNLSNVQLVGISTFASALVVMFMVYPQLPDDNVWTQSDAQDIALTEAPPPPPLEMPESDQGLAEEMLAAPSEEPVSEESASKEGSLVQADDVVDEQPSLAVVKEAQQRKKAVNKQPKVVKAPIEQQVVETPAPTAPAKAAVIADNQSVEAEMPQAPSSSEASDADLAQDEQEVFVREDKAAQPRMAARRAAAPQADATIESLAKAKPAQSKQALTGAALAKKDIQMGHLRILFAGDRWPENQPMVDEETGFRIELTTMPVSEVDVYNQTMRDWHQSNE